LEFGAARSGVGDGVALRVRFASFFVVTFAQPLAISNDDAADRGVRSGGPDAEAGQFDRAFELRRVDIGDKFGEGHQRSFLEWGEVRELLE